MPDATGVCAGAQTSRSRLVGFTGPPASLTPEASKFEIVATYQIDRLFGNPDDPNTPDAPNACLLVTQRYEFFREGLDACEPSGEFPCGRFKPIVEYKYTSEQKALSEVMTAQRLQFTIADPEKAVSSTIGDSAVFFHDCDFVPCVDVVPLPLHVVQAFNNQNPLLRERALDVIVSGKSVPTTDDSGRRRTMDNFHQTNNAYIDEPVVNPGCPECVHIHWRWSTAIRPTGAVAFGVVPQFVSPRFEDFAQPLISPGSNQDVRVAVVAEHMEEMDPVNARDLADNRESLGTSQLAARPVFWYFGKGHRASDRIFGHGGFFSSHGSLPVMSTLTIAPDPAPANGSAAVTFGLSGVPGHTLQWSATLVDSPGVVITPMKGEVMLTGPERTQIGAILEPGFLAASATIIITVKDVDTNETISRRVSVAIRQ